MWKESSPFSNLWPPIQRTTWRTGKVFLHREGDWGFVCLYPCYTLHFYTSMWHPENVGIFKKQVSSTISKKQSKDLTSGVPGGVKRANAPRYQVGRGRKIAPHLLSDAPPLLLWCRGCPLLFWKWSKRAAPRRVFWEPWGSCVPSEPLCGVVAGVQAALLEVCLWAPPPPRNATPYVYLYMRAFEAISREGTHIQMDTEQL